MDKTCETDMFSRAASISQLLQSIGKTMLCRQLVHHVFVPTFCWDCETALKHALKRDVTLASRCLTKYVCLSTGVLSILASCPVLAVANFAVTFSGARTALPVVIAISLL